MLEAAQTFKLKLTNLSSFLEEKSCLNLSELLSLVMWYVFVMFASVYETYVCVVGSLCTGQTETVNIYFLWLQFSAVSEGPFIFARFSSSSFAART